MGLLRGAMRGQREHAKEIANYYSRADEKSVKIHEIQLIGSGRREDGGGKKHRSEDIVVTKLKTQTHLRNN